MFWCCVLALYIVCIVMINVLFSRLYYEQSWNFFFMKIWKLSPMSMSRDAMWSLFSCHPPNFHASALIALLKVHNKILLFNHLWLLFSARLSSARPVPTHGSMNPALKDSRDSRFRTQHKFHTAWLMPVNKLTKIHEQPLSVFFNLLLCYTAQQ